MMIKSNWLRYRLPVLFQLAVAMLLFTSVSYADEFEVVVAGTIELTNSADPAVGDPFDLDGSNFELRFIYDTDAPQNSSIPTDRSCSFSFATFSFVQATYSFTNRPNGAQDVVADVGFNISTRNSDDCSPFNDIFGFPQGSVGSPEFSGLVAGNGAGLAFANTYFSGTDPVAQLPVVDPADVVEINHGPYVFFSSQHGILYDYASANLVSITPVEEPVIEEPGQFELYVADFTRVVRVDDQGNATTFIGGLIGAIDIAVDGTGHFYVAENGRDTIKKYSPDGTDLGIFAFLGSDGVVAVDVDAFGNVFAAGDGGSKVSKYDASGNLIRVFDVTTNPSDLIIDSNNNVLVSDLNADQIWRYDNDGNNEELFATIPRATYLTYGPNGNLFVSQLTLDQVSEVGPNGTDLGVYASSGLQDSSAIAFDPMGNLYVGDNSADNIRRYSSSGADLGVFTPGVRVPIGIVVVPIEPEPPVEPVLLGDCNVDGVVNFVDIASFIAVLSSGGYLPEADVDENQDVNFEDISVFVEILLDQ